MSGALLPETQNETQEAVLKALSWSKRELDGWEEFFDPDEDGAYSSTLWQQIKRLRTIRDVMKSHETIKGLELEWIPLVGEYRVKT